MALKGKFEWYISPRAAGRKFVRFVLTNDNLFQSETFDCALMAVDPTVQPMVFQNLNLPVKKSLAFDYDTVDWTWCDGDRFAILGRNNSVKHEWPLGLQTYKPGECPDCHGTKRCRVCSGKGFVRGSFGMERCQACQGTGECFTCYVPVRSVSPSAPSSNATQARSRQCEALRTQIADLQEKIRNVDWDIRMMQIDGRDVSSRSMYMTYVQQRSQYRIMLNDLQMRLSQLENM